jgi:hypothetical protein
VQQAAAKQRGQQAPAQRQQHRPLSVVQTTVVQNIGDAFSSGWGASRR